MRASCATAAWPGRRCSALWLEATLVRTATWTSWLELDPAADLDVYDYVGVVQLIERLFPVPVDVANRESLDAHVRPEADRDAIYAF